MLAFLYQRIAILQKTEIVISYIVDRQIAKKSERLSLGYHNIQEATNKHCHIYISQKILSPQDQNLSSKICQYNNRPTSYYKSLLGDFCHDCKEY